MANTNDYPYLKANKPVQLLDHQATYFLAAYEVDQPQFAALNPKFTVAWGTAFGAALTLAKATKAPKTAISQQKQKTGEADALLLPCEQIMDRLYYALGSAYPGDEAKLEMYWKDRFTAAKRSRTLMAELMQNAVTLLPDDQAELIPEGFTLAKIGEVATLMASLQAGDKVQMGKVIATKRTREPYVDNWNAVWALMEELHKAAKVAFADSPAKQRTYMLHPEKAAGELEFTMVIPAGALAEYHHILQALKPAQVFTFTILEGAGTAHVCFAIEDGGACGMPALAVAPGEPVSYTYAQFGGAGQHLRVTQDGVVEMRVRVKVEEEEE